MTPEEIEHWTPAVPRRLPDAGRVMYRVDATLDEPKRSTILCGPCGHRDARSMALSRVGFHLLQRVRPRTLWEEEE